MFLVDQNHVGIWLFFISKEADLLSLFSSVFLMKQLKKAKSSKNKVYFPPDRKTFLPSDSEVWRRSWAENFVLVSFDKD